MSMNAIHRAQSGLNVAQRKPVHRSQHGKHEYRGSPGRTLKAWNLSGVHAVTEEQAAGSDPVRNAIEGSKRKSPIQPT